MQNLWLGSQLYIGKAEQERFSITAIQERIARAREQAQLDALAIWVEDAPEIFDQVVRFCRECGIEAYLWFPVLADVNGYRIKEEDLVVTCAGQKGVGSIGRWPQLGTNGEDFLFICPNKPDALENVFAGFQQAIQHPDLMGVMLDRIRYPSAANGFETLFTCFCESCCDKFEKAQGGSLLHYKDKVAVFLDRLQNCANGALYDRDDFRATWEVAGLQPFTNFRNSNIFDLVKKFSAAARVRGLKVGLDLYSVSIASLVGQDYPLLSPLCDWIKPMSYCHAVGPAALPLETYCLWQALEISCPALKSPQGVLEKLLGVSLPEKKENLLRDGIYEEFFGLEMKKIQALPIGRTKVFAGIEAVQNPIFNIHIDEKILKRYLSSLHSSPDGFMASWNLMYIPDENLKVLRNQGS